VANSRQIAANFCVVIAPWRVPWNAQGQNNSVDFWHKMAWCVTARFLRTWIELNSSFEVWSVRVFVSRFVFFFFCEFWCIFDTCPYSMRSRVHETVECPSVRPSIFVSSWVCSRRSAANAGSVALTADAYEAEHSLVVYLSFCVLASLICQVCSVDLPKRVVS